MVKQECLIGSSNLPKFADNLYHDAEEDFWFVPTAEVPLTNIHRMKSSKPVLCRATTWPTRPVSAARRWLPARTRGGIKRGHQFDKVEMYKYTTPETSFDELEKLVGDAEDICQKLGFAYRVLQLCTGDLASPRPRPMTWRSGPWLPGVAGGQQLQQLHGFPGSKSQPEVPARTGCQAAVRAHPQRFRTGSAQGAYRIT